MKRVELLRSARCNLCHRGIGHTKLPLFWRLRIERFGVDLRAAQRQDALGTFLGSQVLGAVMGPDEDLAKPVMDPVTVTVCEDCALDKRLPVAVMAEAARIDAEAAATPATPTKEGAAP